jgi:hypothetical protein
MALPKWDLHAGWSDHTPERAFCCSRIFPTKTSTGMRLVSCATSAVSHSWTNSSDPRQTRSTAAIAMTPSLPPAVMAAAKSLEPVSVWTLLSLFLLGCSISKTVRYLQDRCDTYLAAGFLLVRLGTSTTKCMSLDSRCLRFESSWCWRLRFTVWCLKEWETNIYFPYFYVLPLDTAMDSAHRVV